MKRVLYLAPMCTMPAVDGCSHWIHDVVRTINTAGHHSAVIGNNFICEYNEASEPTVQHFNVHWQSKPLAAIRALLTAGHYGEVKFTNPEYYKIVRDYSVTYQPDVLIIAFIWMYPLHAAVPDAKAIIIDTHNDEWALLKGYSKQAINPLVRRLCNTSMARLEAIMQGLPPTTRLMHITESDVMAHKLRRPDMPHICVMPGIVPTPRASTPDYTLIPKSLLFCGNLSNQINQDALAYFADEYWPKLRDVCNLTVAGSNPCKRIINLCKSQGWRMVCNFSNEQKIGLYEAAHFTIVPASYGAGSKLKMLESIAYMVPVLTNHAGTTGGHSYPSYVTVCDDPDMWRNTILSTRYKASWPSELADFAEIYSSSNTMQPLLDVIETCDTHS